MVRLSTLTQVEKVEGGKIIKYRVEKNLIRLSRDPYIGLTKAKPAIFH